MLTLDDYLDLAKKRQGLRSDRRLSARLGFADAIVSQMRRGMMRPADATMIRLAELAGLDPDEALLHLAQWRAATPEVRESWERIYRKVMAAVVVLAALTAAPIGDSAAASEVHKAPVVYYGKFQMGSRTRHFREIPGIFATPSIGPALQLTIQATLCRLITEVI